MDAGFPITITELERDPYPIYARLRQNAPVAYVPAANVWFVTRWQDVDTVTKSPDLFSAEAPTSPVELSFGKPTILTTDGPVHKELRAGVEPHYRPRKVAEYIDALVRPIAEEYLANLPANTPIDLMANYFEPISVLSLVKSFGLDGVSVPTLRRWFYGLSQGAINYERDPARQAISDATCAEVDAAVLPLLEKLAKHPESSPLSHMLHSGMPEGKTRSPQHILPSVKVTLLGGMQEPGHGAGSVLVGLLQNPDQLAAVLAEPAAMLPKAVNEGLRWVAPIGTQMRIACDDLELGGVAIKKGEPIAAILASASHDEARFTDPGKFNMHRNEGQHAAFGFGNHFCAGRWFATAQIEIALKVLLDAYPQLKLVANKTPEFRGWEFRAPISVDVVLNGRAA